MRFALFCLTLMALSMTAKGQVSTTTYDEYFHKYAKRYFGAAFDWRLFKAQAIAESGLDSAAQSYVGARGLMQLMPSTFREIQSKNPEMDTISDPRWNIAAGIYYDRVLWRQWNDGRDFNDHLNFIFGSYNAGPGTIKKAEKMAQEKNLDSKKWPSIEEIAPAVSRWRHEETLTYVKRIRSFHAKLTQERKK